MKNLKHALMILFSSMALFGLQACEQEGAFENTGESADQGVENTQDVLNDGAETTGEAVEDTGNTVDEQF